VNRTISADWAGTIKKVSSKRPLAGKARVVSRR